MTTVYLPVKIAAKAAVQRRVSVDFIRGSAIESGKASLPLTCTLLEREGFVVQITKEQAVTVAETLVAPGNDALEASKAQRIKAELKARDRQRVGMFGGLGMLIGGAAAYMLSANISSYAVLGFAIGAIAGRFFSNRTRI